MDTLHNALKDLDALNKSNDTNQLLKAILDELKAIHDLLDDQLKDKEST